MSTLFPPSLIVICILCTSITPIGVPKEGSYAILRQMFGHNCTEIVGNLILFDLFVNEDGTDPDLSFLATIREISGYLIIMHSNVARIPLSQLRVIRAENGGYRINNTLDAAALVVRNNHLNGHALRQVDLGNLRSIVQGSVFIYENPGLCYLPSRINWFEIFENVGEQHLFDDQLIIHKTPELRTVTYNAEGDSYANCAHTDCSNNCPEVEGKRYCWGPLPTECQLYSKCDNSECNRCQRPPKNASCCHEQCLGGCSGPLASDCESCKEFNDSGTCVADCSYSLSSSPSGGVGENAVAKYHLGHMCLSECPRGFLLERDKCVTHCARGLMSKDGQSCQPCNGQCPKTCKLDHVISKNGQKVYLVDAKSLKSIEGCTHLKGDLKISNESFHSSNLVTNHIPITEPGQLWSLHSLQEVSGYVYLDLGLLGDRLKNLSFLENLERVSGTFVMTRASVTIVNSGARVPGLRSLRMVPHGHVFFSNNPHLCYLNSLPWTVVDKQSAQYDERILENMQIEVHAGPPDKECEALRCHALCDAKYGCWGPGQDQCVRCAHRRAGQTTCVESCRNLPGFRHDVIPSPKASSKRPLPDSHFTVVHREISMIGLPETEKVCIACHPECRQTCDGPGPHQCIGDCKTAWADGRCVSTCPHGAYLNQDRRICQPCHKHCHQRLATQQPVCTGPGRYPGPGGCNKCKTFLVSRAVPPYTGRSEDASNQSSVVCFRGACPSGTFLTVEKISPSSRFAAFTETYTGMVQVCWACHSLCLECNAYGLVEAGTDQTGCLKCAGVWHRGICMGHCPAASTYEIPLETVGRDAARVVAPLSSDSSQSKQQQQQQQSAITAAKAGAEVEAGQVTRVVNGRCLDCHQECHEGCWGPGASQCHLCRHFRVYPSLLRQDVREQLSGEFALQPDPSDPDQQGERPLHEIPGVAVCVPACMPGHKFTPVDPHSGDRVCHHQASLSPYEQDQIRDMLLAIRQRFEPINRYSSKGNWTATVLAVVILFGILVLLFCFCFCCNLRRFGWSKRGSMATAPPVLLRLLLPSSLASRLMPGKYFRQNEDQNMWRGSGTGLLAGWKHIHESVENGDKGFAMVDVSSALPADQPSSNETLISKVSRAPNLGRLVMINSDDFQLDEDCGPLGTGAFGAVYRGIWRVSLSDETSTGSSLVSTEKQSHLYEGVSTSSTNNESTGKKTESPPPLIQFDELSSISTRNSVPETGRRPHSKTEIKVAVKILNDSRGGSDLEALLDEAKVMASVTHRHCLPLLGVCVSQGRRCLVSGYVANGSLDRYLRQHSANLSVNLLLEWSSQIADGMAYLQSLGIIHRDLATRNVLVTSRYHLQITDFGLAKMLEGGDSERHGEVVVRSGRAPIRWLAIETLTHGRYSSKTDVWAYGVTVWEIFTFGDKPYDGIDTANIKAHILSGGRLPKPKTCTVELHQVMLKCWSVEPDDRPNFIDLYNLFKEFPRHPELYQTSQPLSEKQSPVSNKKAVAERRSEDRDSFQSKQVDCGSPSGPGGRRFDLRRPLRNSLCSPTMLQHVRLSRLHQNQKRRSSETSTEPTLSTSLSMTSSGLWDQASTSCSTSALVNRSHLALVEVSEDATNTEADNGQSDANPTCQPGSQRANNPPADTDRHLLKSWASSSRPFLSSDHESSASQPMLCNLGYASSSSSSIQATDSSPAPHTNAPPAYAPVGGSQGDRPATQATVRPDEINEMPSNFVLEEAAGYVWPHWPSAYAESLQPTTEGIQTSAGQGGSAANSEQLPFLKRRLWLRRSARQHRYYLQQSLLHQAAVGMTVPEQVNEEFLEEGSSQPRQAGDTEVNDRWLLANSTTTGNLSADNRYYPDPTNLPDS